MTIRRNPGARLKADIRSYADAKNFMRGAERVRIAHNTFLAVNIFERPEERDTISVILHNTAIVRFHSDGRITLNSGGYQTATTKDRINKFLPPGYSLYQQHGQWWIEPRGHKESRVKFYDGMVLAPFGQQWGGIGYTVNPHPLEAQLREADYEEGAYGWIITKDNLHEKWMKEDPELAGSSGEGTIGPRYIKKEILAALKKGKGRLFKMYDDDNELYYTGRYIGPEPLDEFAFGPLDDYGMPNAGCTRIDYRSDSGKWETL